MTIRPENFMQTQANADGEATGSSSSTESTSIQSNARNTWRHAVMESTPPPRGFTGADHGRDRLGLPDDDNPDDLESN